jgi:hypothetical protein
MERESEVSNRRSEIGEASCEEYHEGVRGKPVLDKHYAENNRAPNIRWMVLRIMEKSSMAGPGEIAEMICVSGNTLSRAAYGRAGSKTRKDTGMSTTDMVYIGLRDLYSELVEGDQQ